jgi:hypothetical protein
MIPEIAFMLYPICIFKFFVFLLTIILIFYNSIDMFIETYGIFNNLTRNEIFNRNRY